ncbi:hypothetical protein HK102_001514 [Quaeritorhiza haematococci]|nr:hypothetical protein HK102_001514 [Quaeritorhiza haematococci]
MAAEVDYYEILNVPETATDDEIRQAYIKESLKWHPDRNNAPEATARFQQVGQAYFTLSDKDRRREYDAARRSHRKYGAENVDPHSIFGGVFDELLQPQVPNPSYFYQPLGGAGGAMLGFIIMNIPGAIAGYYFGSKMGRIRDFHGVSVYEAFSKLGQEKRAEILTHLAQKMFASAM